MPRVLLLSSLYPTDSSPGQGIFISKRIAAHKTIGTTVAPIALDYAPTRMLRKVLNSRRRPLPVHAESDSVFSGTGTALSLRTWLHQTQSFPSRHAVAETADSVSRILDVGTFDVIHAHGMYGAMAGAVAAQLKERHRLPVVITVHGSDVTQLMPRYSTEFKRTFDAADALIYVSEYLRRRTEEEAQKQFPSRVIGNGVDASVFGLKLTTPADTSLPNRRQVVSYIGGLSAIKGADLLPDIFRSIHANCQTKFVVAGDGPLRRELSHQFRDLPVTMLGQVKQTEVADLMRASRVVVVPSQDEGFGCVALEAQACGATVVASSVGGLPEIVADDHYLVEDFNDANAFARRIEDVLSAEPTPTMQSSAVPSWDQIAELEQMLYMDLMRGKELPRS